MSAPAFTAATARIWEAFDKDWAHSHVDTGRLAAHAEIKKTLTSNSSAELERAIAKWKADTTRTRADIWKQLRMAWDRRNPPHDVIQYERFKANLNFCYPDVRALQDAVDAWIQQAPLMPEGKPAELWVWFERTFKTIQAKSPNVYNATRKETDTREIYRFVQTRQGDLQQAMERWKSLLPRTQVEDAVAYAEFAMQYTPQERRWRAISFDTTLEARLYKERVLVNPRRYVDPPSPRHWEKYPYYILNSRAVKEIERMDDSKGWQAAVDLWMQQNPLQTAAADQTALDELVDRMCARCDRTGTAAHVLIKCGHLLCTDCVGRMQSVGDDWFQGHEKPVYECLACDPSVKGALVPLAELASDPVLGTNILPRLH